MAPNGRQRAHIAHRRRRVAALRLRGLTGLEIVAALAHERDPIVNPKTGAPYDFSTVYRDLQYLEAQWSREALGDIAEHKGINLAETREARRQSWRDADLSGVYKFLKREADLLGLDAPTRQEHGGKITHEHQVALSPDAIALLEEIANRKALSGVSRHREPAMKVSSNGHSDGHPESSA